MTRAPLLHRALLTALVLATAAGTARAQTTDFARLITRLSEPAGYFDSDNLVSNETGYLHALGGLRALGVRGGAYLGVGPEQNFSYIAAIEPEIAILVDIRRDNMLLHLLFRAMFEAAGTRLEYLSMLIGRPAPRDAGSWRHRPLAELLFYLDTTALDSVLHESNHARLMRRVAAYGLPLDDRDRAIIRRFHDEFARGGLNLTFTSRGGFARRAYPTLRRLYLETDLEGLPGSYLASDVHWQRVRRLQRSGRIVPVVGDLGGRTALQAIARYLESTRRTVSAFYISNVEMYLFRNGAFEAFAANMRSLPARQNSVLIRSVFDRSFQPAPDYFSTQMIQRFSRFLDLAARAQGVSYRELVTDRDPAATTPVR